MNGLCTSEYYSAFTREEMLARGAIRANLEDTIQSAGSQSQKDECCVTSLTQGTQRSQVHRDRKSDDGRRMGNYGLFFFKH